MAQTQQPDSNARPYSRPRVARPNPAEMVCCGFDAGHVRGVISQAMKDSRGCHVDITLKDIHTVENQPGRLSEWVKTVRNVLNDC